MKLLFGFFLLISAPAFATLLEGEMSTPASIYTRLSEEKSIIVELGMEYVHPAIPNIQGVIVENSSTSTALGPNATKTGDVLGGYPDAFAQTLKFQALLQPKNRFTLGLKTYLPLNGLSSMDTGNAYQPELPLYRGEGQRPRILLTSGMDLSPDWRLGLGLDVGFSVDAQANVFLQSGSGTVSDERVSAKVKPSLIPQGSIIFRDLEFTVRGENKAEMKVTTNSGARVFSTASAGLDFSFISQSAIYYQPWQFEMNAKTRVSDLLGLKYGLSYELWSGYEARAAIIQSNVQVNCPAGAGNCVSLFSSGLTPSFKARNLLIPELLADFSLGDDSLGVGYRYKDSIFKDLPTGTGNYVDPPRHDFLVSYNHLSKSGWQWNIHANVSRLSSVNVVKSNPTTEIGGPGYQVAGWLYGGGLGVTVPFKSEKN